MISRLRSELTSLFPMVIRQASYTDPSLSLVGDQWSFNSQSSWRVTRHGVLEFGWSDVGAPDQVWNLIGLSIVSVAPQSLRMQGDPALELSSGQWVEIFSDHAVDPWVFGLPAMTFVGSPSDPAWVDGTQN